MWRVLTDLGRNKEKGMFLVRNSVFLVNNLILGLLMFGGFTMTEV